MGCISSKSTIFEILEYRYPALNDAKIIPCLVPFFALPIYSTLT